MSEYRRFALGDFVKFVTAFEHLAKSEFLFKNVPSILKKNEKTGGTGLYF